MSFFPRDVLDEILNLIMSVSESFPTYTFFKKVNGLFYELKSVLRRHNSEAVKHILQP